MKTRRRFMAEFKAKVALEAICGERTISELGTKHQLYPIQITQWKRQAVENLTKAFDDEGGDGRRIPAIEIETIVLGQLKELVCNVALMSSWMREACDPAGIEAGLAKAEEAASVLDATTSLSEDMRAIIHMAIRRIDLDAPIASASQSTRAP